MEVVKAKRGADRIKPLLEVAEHRGVIAGGYAAWSAAPKEYCIATPGDVDIFTYDEYGMACILDGLGRLGYYSTFISETAYTMENQTLTVPIVQVVRPRAWQTPQEVIDEFDFSVAQAAYVSPRKILIGDHYMEDLAARRLRLLRVNHPLLTVRRIAKYVAKGYEIGPDQVVKLFNAWDALTPEVKAEMLEAMFPAKGDEPEDDEDYGPGWGWASGERFSSWDGYDDDDYEEEYSWY